MIFNFFKNFTDTTISFKIKFYQINVIDVKVIVPKFKIKTIIDDKNITIKLFRNQYANGEYPDYYVNFTYNNFGYSFFKFDKEENNNPDDDYYQFLQTFELK
ncbi:hypothetical protein [Spiroplasma endosymbiont of Polydrusus formosus]|uniref:hypothetical protein n=1 Tax=Spiroplasma endosymbiont of Polydrusus formosus TaxID=3139326 RepID=UPI0035B524BB